ncbi:unnamed protein product [Sympodiomycopsis kandeliae]
MAPSSRGKGPASEAGAAPASASHDTTAPRGGPRGRGRGRGRGAPRGGAGGRGGGSSSRRGNFGGGLTKRDAQADDEDVHHTTLASSSGTKGKGRDDSEDAKLDDQEQTTSTTPSDKKEETADDDDDEADVCWICAEPVKLYSLGPCNHRTCHICAIRLRALYKVQECTFCKASLDQLIFTKDPEKPFTAFAGPELPYSDAKLKISFEDKESMQDTLILLRFNCPDERCDVASAGWADLKMHARRDHDRLLCDLCIRNKKIFAHEHTLHTTQSLTAHMKQDHRFCEYCANYFYSDDELFVHMRDRHEQCHICKASGNEAERWKYYKDYNMLEQHFRRQHYLCPTRECLEKKFVVFDSEMDFKAHQVQEHGADLSSRELKEAMKIEANFHYEDPNAAGSSSGARSRKPGRGGRRDRDPEPPTNADPLGLSTLALRANVPGAGPANHSRRIQFGGHTTSSADSEQSQQVAARAAADRAAGETDGASTAERHEAYLKRVHSVMGGSDSKVGSFRNAVKIFRAGEMGASDLVDTIHSLVGDLDSSAVVVNGLVDLLDTDQDKKRSVLDAWNKLRVQRTAFPSLVPIAGGSGPSLRNVKNRTSASANSQVWANVERAAARGSGHGAGKPSVTREHFPTLGQASGSNNRFYTSASGNSKANVPGSAAHSAKVNGTLRATHGSTPWSQASTSSRVTPLSAPSPPIPYSANSYPSASNMASKLSGKTPSGTPNGSSTPSSTVRTSNKQAFPSLPTNASAAAMAAHKKTLFARDRENNKSSSASRDASGTSTPAFNPAAWGGISGGAGGGNARIDTPLYSPTNESNNRGLDAGQLGQRLADTNLAAPTENLGGAGGKGAKKKNKGVSVLSMGGVHRGA